MNDIKKRKDRHLKLSLDSNVQSDISNGFQDVRFIHRSLPEFNLDEISSEITLFDKTLKHPLIISAITGGTEYAKTINSTLAEVAEELSIGIGVGSQRIAIENPSIEHTFTIVREKAPTTLVMANIGCPQISLGWGVKEAKRCIDMIDADALTIHMNPLQEAVQVGGETHYKGVLKKLSKISKEIDVPVIMKETGCGISREVAEELEEIGISGLELSGLGGTSWAAVEHHIARVEKKTSQETLGKALWNWGIPTAISTVETSRSTTLKIISSGGIRTGIEAAKAIALGANAVGIAQPFLEKAIEGKAVLCAYINEILMELKTVMFLVGAKDIEELKMAPVLILGRTAEWLRLRGYDLKAYANKRINRKIV